MEARPGEKDVIWPGRQKTAYVSDQGSILDKGPEAG